MKDNEKQYDEKIINNLMHVKKKVAVLSGKGGVGKSTMTSMLAVALARRSLSVGILDVDIHGPNIPWIFGLHTTVFPTEEDRVTPVQSALGIKIASVGALGYDENTAFIWRGPMKLGVIKQFLSEVDWGDLDVLLIDTPPGTGDELMTVAEHIPDLDGCIVVTTPQALAVLDARKSISFARKFNIQVYGIVENMSDTKTQKMFGTGGGQRAAQELGQHFLGNVACDPSIVEMCNGKIENISVSVLPVSVIEALV